MSKVDRMKRLTINEKLALVRRVYNHVLDHTESFEEEHIGADLAYLLGAIANGSCCEWEEDRPLVELLKRTSFKGKDVVMLHVQVAPVSMVDLDEGG